MSRRLGVLLTVIAAVVVLAATVYVIGKKDPVPDAGTTPTLSGAGLPTSTAITARTVVAFLGDDYTAGAGASKNSKRFTTLLAGSLSITEKNFGDAGAGYAKTGDGGKTYADAVDAVAAVNPDVVVLSGGRNDQGDNSDTVVSAARSLFATLHEKLPHAVLIAVAPFWGDSDQPPAIKAISAAIRDGVEAVGGSYVALADPLHNHPNYMADAADPNDAGYAAIASALKPKLAGLLPR